LFMQLEEGFWDLLTAELQSYFGKLDLVSLSGAQVVDEVCQIPTFFSLVFQRVNESLGLTWSERATQLVAGCDPHHHHDDPESSARKSSRRRNSAATHKVLSLRHIGRRGGSDPAMNSSGSLSARATARKVIFVEDVTIGLRTKTTSISALAAGLHWIRMSEEVTNHDDSAYFRELARNSLEKALQNNPTNPVTTRELAKILWLNVADAKGICAFEVAGDSSHVVVTDFPSQRSASGTAASTTPGGSKEEEEETGLMAGSLRPFWFESSLRYADSLFCVSLQNATGEILADSQADYARFLLAGGSNPFKAALLLVSACQTRWRERDAELLVRVLVQVGLEHEAALLQ
jgi:hypothetical protein